MKLLVIIASTRPTRIGDQIGNWFAGYAKEHSNFEIEVADLAELNLPMFDEPNHPMLGQYVHEHTKQWSRQVAGADAFVIVTPEYNYTMPPSLVNAIDYLHAEWKYKPVAFVGYGGHGAARAIQTAKQLTNTLSMMPIFPAIYMTGVGRRSPDPVVFEPLEAYEKAADILLAELAKWAQALLPLHQA